MYGSIDIGERKVPIALVTTGGPLGYGHKVQSALVMEDIRNLSPGQAGIIKNQIRETYGNPDLPVLIGYIQ